MRLTQVVIDGFKRFTHFELPLEPNFNIIVGDNETGKSSLLEAIGLVLTGQYDGRLIQYALDPYLFNATAVLDYFTTRRSGQHSPPPRISIEAYMESVGNEPAVATLKGTNNSKSQDSAGLVLTIEVDPAFVDTLSDYAADGANPTVVPVELFRTTWRSFSGESVSVRKLPFRAAIIDAGRPRFYRGPNRYVSQLVDDVLSEGQRRDLSLNYRRLQHLFSQEPGVKAINEHLSSSAQRGDGRHLSVRMDLSSRSSWDNAITAHLDDLPFDCAGKGEQCRLQFRLAVAAADQSQVLLIEEPENHLSHSHLSMLLNEIKADCTNRQVVITTHSGFVLNKLGLDNLKLISRAGRCLVLTGLTAETRDYFMKLPGYDTLRLLLSRRSILVEGPSDELVVMRAYKDKHGRLPLDDGVDVISVGSLAFKRFLEIVARLGLETRVVTDNDANVAALSNKYSDYLAAAPNIRICFDSREDYPTLEPQLLLANSIDLLNDVLNTSFTDPAALLAYMAGRKTDCALRFFETTTHWESPGYISDAVA